MGYKNTRYNDEAIVITQYFEPFDNLREPYAAAAETEQLMADVPGTIYTIVDLSTLNYSFSDLMIGMAEMAARPEAFDTRFRAVLVGTSEMVRLMVEAAKQKQYGQREFPLFSTIGEALSFVHSQQK